MNRHRIFFAILLLLSIGCSAALFDARLHTTHWMRRELPQLRQLAAELTLTDLAIWSEARYTRHPSQADLFTPFQDFPGAPEHFPAGSLVDPEVLRLTLKERAANHP